MPAGEFINDAAIAAGSSSPRRRRARSTVEVDA
jgi:hypothetical protein